MSTAEALNEGYVLVVDDEEGIRDTLSEVVEMGGCSAVAASDGAEALKLLAKRRPCLVILDLLMPIMSGVELLDAIRKEPSLVGLPIVISTSAPNRAPPGVQVLPKPVDIGAVWDCMRRACVCASAGLPGAGTRKEAR
jgi:CheY-like chemotaxis protein